MKLKIILNKKRVEIMTKKGTKARIIQKKFIRILKSKKK